jgi:transketolase
MEIAEPTAGAPAGHASPIDAFGQALVTLGAERSDLVVLDADVEDTGTDPFRARYPDRFLHFGMGEQNMIAAAGGLAAVGLVPVVASHAVLCLRAVEQARLSLAFAERNVKIVATRAGLDAGPEGGAAQALEDIAVFRAIPGMTVVSPADGIETALATRAIMEFQGPVYMRTGRGSSPPVFGADHRFEIGKGTIVRDGADVTLVACGVQVARAVEAAYLLEQDGISARVVNMATIKPIDRDLLIACSEKTRAIVTAEDHNLVGGLGGAVAEALAATRPCPIEMVGVSDRFGETGEPGELAEQFGIGATHIAAAARRAIARKST